MTKQQKTRITETAIEQGMIPLQSMDWNQAMSLAISYHASFKKSKKPKEESELYKSLVDIWLKEVHPSWTVFTSIDGAAMKSIESKMRAWIANPNNQIPVIIDKNYFENFFRHFCKKLPEFYKNQTLNVLASKFDSIIEEIKTQNAKKRIGNARPAERHSDFAR